MRELFAQEIRRFNDKGWSPATSTNYSFRTENQLDVIHVSRSGIDKAHFTADDFMDVNLAGVPVPPFEGIRPSAETGIHCALYDLFPETMCIVHSHSVYSVLHSSVANSEVVLEGFEVLKGFEGIKTHEVEVACPIFDNSQDIAAFCEVLKANKDRLTIPAFIMRKHGTYAWGRNLFEAKRHLETIEYLLEVSWKLR